MMNIFRHSPLTQEDLDQLESLMKTVQLEKQDYFIREGHVCRQLAFLRKGILRSFYVKDNGEEITDCIMFEGQLVTAYASLITGQPAFENMQAITECELQVLDRDDLYRLYEQNIRWANTGRAFGEQEFVMMEQRIRSFQQYTAKERYEEMVRQHPRMIQQVPLQYLASYLGITPQHLSRLRKS
ncbi:cAMP-binding domain of CRP or a regulatory subunit of cAMP-dependent protein kinases [Chitinophaga eiseniae]|uniref:cAMP-binding domain of CRP or a regulatory subunit of cAMP-dependent protein kinases n=1 Tax=Chitinophaga eiseniae TaxID=634771 RepID=A0A1T4N2V9_9BACT|nr:Crp/Fnr family transcriptional regulator [Chitinophaga eiseniae]SJZ73464.1 cAMP-binding domain of CRP or a regulatory subunit of cAMP-dependent protein kinases [Chitinophaga eiseniae]